MNTAAAVAYSDTIDRARYHIFTNYRDSFRAVVEHYVKVRQLSPVVASTYDPDGLDRSTKLSYNLIDWLVDVERITTEALKGHLDLQAAWFSIGLGEPVDSELEREVTNRCGRLYVSRRVEPWRYWNKHPQPRGAGR